MFRCMVSTGFLWILVGGVASAQSPQALGVDIIPYPGAEVHSMGDRARVNGQDYRIYYFTTRASPLDVAKFYQHQWNEQHQIVVVNQLGRSGVSLGYYDMKTGQSYSVSAWKEGGLTYGFPAVVNGVALPLAMDSSLSKDVPIHPLAEGLMTHESLERGASFQTWSYFTNVSFEDTETFILKDMGKRGFTLSERQGGSEPPKNLMLDFSNGRQQMNISLVWLPKNQRCSVFIVTQLSEKIEGEDSP